MPKAAHNLFAVCLADHFKRLCPMIGTEVFFPVRIRNDILLHSTYSSKSLLPYCTPINRLKAVIAVSTLRNQQDAFHRSYIVLDVTMWLKGDIFQ